MTLLSPTFTMPSWTHMLRPQIRQPQTGDFATVAGVRRAERHRVKLSNESLRAEIVSLRQQIDAGATPDDTEVLVPSLALASVALQRVVGIHCYDVQLLAGLLLARGGIAEIDTGEGKTYVTALAAVARGMTGHGVHVMTVNRYLAERDFNQLRKVFELLGLSASLLLPQAAESAKRAAYAADIVYGPGYEFGFDYLRDQLALRKANDLPRGQRLRQALLGARTSPAVAMQREHAHVIIDEVDSILIDEANTPLVLSQTAGAKSTKLYELAAHLIDQLSDTTDYVIDRTRGDVRLTTKCASRCQTALPAGMARHLARPWTSYLKNALRARHLMSVDVDFVVNDGKVKLVDQATGRVLDDRSWQDGLHQAVEVVADVEITAEHGAAARIARQRFMGLYSGISGLTGTATGCEQEFWKQYQVAVTKIPRNRPNRCQARPVRFFANDLARCDAVIKEIVETQASGRPVLVGTRTIAQSEWLAERLQATPLQFQLLNGKQDGAEAAIIAAAGERGAVTIATNMAGRGTDIRLGPGVAELGGLHVIGVESHDSLRVDRQLAGRAGRQGDPGSYQFYASADDALLQQYGRRLAEKIKRTAPTSGLSSRSLTDALRRVQQQAERQAARRRTALIKQEVWRTDLAALLG